MTVTCKNCGIELFEEGEWKTTTPHNFSYRKIFRSFATRKDDEGCTYYLCNSCHEKKNKENFESKQTN